MPFYEFVYVLQGMCSNNGMHALNFLCGKQTNDIIFFAKTFI